MQTGSTNDKPCDLLSNNNKTVTYSVVAIFSPSYATWLSLVVVSFVLVAWDGDLCVRRSHYVSLAGTTLYIPECCWATLRACLSLGPELKLFMVRCAPIIAHNIAIWLSVRPVFLASPDPPIDFGHRCAVGPGYQLECSTWWVEPELVMCKAWSLCKCVTHKRHFW